MQLASTLGFILNKRSGKFLGLTPEEQAAVHECLTWWPLGLFLKKLGCAVESVVFTVVRVCGDAPATGCVSRDTTFTASTAMS